MDNKILFVFFLSAIGGLNLLLLVPMGNLLTGCSTTDPKLEPELKLELKDVSCTEAWLQLTSTNIQIPNNISLLVNGNVTKTFSLSTQDSLLYIDSLLPNQNYKFKVALNTTNNPQPTTNEVQAQTMDTTSHNFTLILPPYSRQKEKQLYLVKSKKYRSSKCQKNEGVTIKNSSYQQ